MSTSAAAQPQGQTQKIAKAEDIPTKTDFKGDDVLDQLLLYFSRTLLEQVAPRPTTGTVKVWKDYDIVAVQEDERLPRVFSKLIVEGFLSVPVLDSHRRYVTTVDMLDLVMFVVDMFTKGGAATTPTQKDWEQFFATEEKWASYTIRDVINHPKQRKPSVFPCYPGVSVLQGMTIFANTQIHRLPVINTQGRVQGFVTQSMVISLLSQNMAMLGRLANAKVADMEAILNPKLITVREDDKAIDAFRLMATHNVSGLGVLNNEGYLVDTISARDLRGIGNNAGRWSWLFQTVKDYKNLTRQEFSAQTPREVLSVTRDDTLARVIDLMDDGNIHRVFLVEREEKGLRPKKVISQGDVIRFIVEAAGIKVTKEEEQGPLSAALEGTPSPQSAAAMQAPPPPKIDTSAAPAAMDTTPVTPTAGQGR